MIACEFEIETFNDKTKAIEKKNVEIKYIVLPVHSKRHNKWFITSDKQPYNPFIKKRN